MPATGKREWATRLPHGRSQTSQLMASTSSATKPALALNALEDSVRSALQQLDAIEDFAEPNENPENEKLARSVCVHRHPPARPLRSCRARQRPPPRAGTSWCEAWAR